MSNIIHEDTAPALQWRQLVPGEEATVADFPDGFGAASPAIGGGWLPLIVLYPDAALDVAGGLWEAPREESREAAQRLVEQAIFDGDMDRRFTRARDPGPDACFGCCRDPELVPTCKRCGGTGTDPDRGRAS